MGSSAVITAVKRKAETHVSAFLISWLLAADLRR